jgi:hypothetical protein
VSADNKQRILPIVEQEPSRAIVEENLRLINCWLGIAMKENIGTTFCADCEYLPICERLYNYFDSRASMHPAFRARRILRSFGIESDYT